MTNKPEMALVMARAMFGFDEDDASARNAAVVAVRKGLAAVRDVECCEEVEDFVRVSTSPNNWEWFIDEALSDKSVQPAKADPREMSAADAAPPEEEGVLPGIDPSAVNDNSAIQGTLQDGPEQIR
jgi:hypothetical protein